MTEIREHTVASTLAARVECNVAEPAAYTGAINSGELSMSRFRSFHSFTPILIAALASLGACKKTESTATKVADVPSATPAARAQPVPAAGTMTGSDWLKIRGADKLKQGDVVTVSYHTVATEDAPCFETNKPGKWTCIVPVRGKNPEGEDDYDTFRADDLNKAQADAYTAKVKPDVDVTLTCKIELSSGYATLTACK